MAVEYADSGQDEDELQKKTSELLKAGTKYVWVARLMGPRRVEIHEKGWPMRVAKPGEELTAPGILKNAVPVLALFDREAAHEATLRNLLQRRGYESLEAVRAQGELTGRREALFTVLRARGLAISDEERGLILANRDPGMLDEWIVRAATEDTTERVIR